jgi:hypothetical protein
MLENKAKSIAGESERKINWVINQQIARNLKQKPESPPVDRLGRKQEAAGRGSGAVILAVMHAVCRLDVRR